MALARGTRLGPYEIVSLRGAGGMGEVYCARDTRLDRTVAIKLLPSRLAANETLRARFEREARAISTLSHPNICALYDVGNETGTEYLVMEYLEGDSLADRLSRGPLPMSLVVRFGVQIADALHHAHRAGITHRDLKPGNIMITASGAKLLDFGLAKFLEPAAQSTASSPTLAAPLTTEGSIVGTTQYMSPEQIEGKPLDPRTDIFSLGVVLYEMATGQRPFGGDSQASVIAAILSSDPAPARSLQPSVTPALDRIIQTALEKNPDNRWQTAHDVARQLQWISESSQSNEQPAVSRQRRIPLVAIIILTAAITAIATWLVTRSFAPIARKQHIHLQFTSPAGIIPVGAAAEGNDIAISRDGHTIALVAKSGSANFIFLRTLDSAALRKLEGTDGALGPFFSSDGQWIAWSARGKLWKTRISGDTPPEALCDVTSLGARGSWVGNTILFAEARGVRKEIFRVPSAGGTPAKVTTLRMREGRHSWPVLLPDGTHFLYLTFTVGTMDRDLVLASLDSPKTTVVARNVSLTCVSHDNRLYYVRDGNLVSQHLDVEKGTVADDVSTIASDVAYFYPTAYAGFAVSDDGTAVYRTDTSSGRISIIDRKGHIARTVDDHSIALDQAISPDGKRAVVTIITRATGLMDLWIYDLTRGVSDRFTSDPGVEVSPAWSPDGRSIIYSESEGGVFPHLVRRTLTGTTSEALTAKDAFEFEAAFAPDGGTVYYDRDAGGGSDIYRLSLKTRKAEPFVQTRFLERSPAVSPDGKWLAFSSSATGVSEVYVQSLDGGEPVRMRVSNNGGRLPMWRGDGRELFYITSGNEVASAIPNAPARWDDVTIVELFHIANEFRDCVVMPDGQSFLLSDWTPGLGDDTFHVILAGKE